MDDRILDKLDSISGQLARTEANTENLKEYIRAVSGNVKEVREDLQEHKEDHEAHGAKAANKQSSGLIALIGLGIALISLLGPLVAAALKN